MEPPLLAEPEELATLTNLSATDANLALALKRASARFQGPGGVGYQLHYQENDTIHLDGTGSRVLLLPAVPIEHLTVAIDGKPVSDWALATRNGVLYRDGGIWPAGLENIEITYSHGYRQIPGDIQDAVLEHATTLAMVYAHVQQESAGGTQVSYGAAATVGTTQKWVETVNAYRLRDRT